MITAPEVDSPTMINASLQIRSRVNPFSLSPLSPLSLSHSLSSLLALALSLSASFSPFSLFDISPHFFFPLLCLANLD